MIVSLDKMHASLSQKDLVLHVQRGGKLVCFQGKFHDRGTVVGSLGSESACLDLNLGSIV